MAVGGACDHALGSASGLCGACHSVPLTETP